MTFDHTKTQKPALVISPYDPSWNNQDDPNLIRVRSSDDLPFFDDMASIVPPEIWKTRGRSGAWHYLSAFFSDKKDRSDFWFMLLPSGFPNGEIPKS